MIALKKGDRIRLSTGVQGVVFQVNRDGSVVFEVGDKKYFVDQDLERIGVTWEVVKPVLVEPPALTPIQFDCYKAENCVHLAFKGADGYWEVTGGSNRFDWEDVLDRFKPTEYEFLRPEKELVKEVLRKARRLYNPLNGLSETLGVIAEEYGVEL